MKSIFIGQFPNTIYFGMFVSFTGKGRSNYSYPNWIDNEPFPLSRICTLDANTMMMHYNQNQFKLELIRG